jgi:uncharacterized protein (TIGR02284 family)
MVGSKELSEVDGALRSVIDVLHDGHQGLLQIGEHLKNETTKLYILSESQVRAEYAAELENELHRHGERDVNEGGTASGTLHRVWGDLKARMGADDRSLLTTAEQGEDEEVKGYEKALEAVMPGDIRDLLLTQKKHIAHSHNKIRDLRDGIAA